jgi:hypothetical protein
LRTPGKGRLGVSGFLLAGISGRGQKHAAIPRQRLQIVELRDAFRGGNEIRLEMTEHSFLQHVFEEIDLPVAFDERVNGGPELLKLGGGELTQGWQRQINQRNLRLHLHVLSLGPDAERFVPNLSGSSSGKLGELLLARGCFMTEQERVEESTRAKRLARGGFECFRKGILQIGGVLQMAGRDLADIRKNGLRRNDRGKGRREWRWLSLARRNRRRLGSGPLKRLRGLSDLRGNRGKLSIERRVQSADAFL